MKTFLTAVSLAAALAGSAQAFTVNAGEVWEGEFDLTQTSDFGTSPCCPLISVDSDIRYQQFYATFAPAIDVGEDIVIALYDSGRTLLGENTFFPGSGTLVAFAGGFPGSTILSSGFVQVRSTTGGWGLSELDIAGGANVTVSHSNGPLATSLQVRDTIFNWTLLTTTPPRTPVRDLGPALTTAAGHPRSFRSPRARSCCLQALERSEGCA